MQTSHTHTHTHTHTPFNDYFLGRVINALVKPMDGKGNIHASNYRQIESPSPEIISRFSVYKPPQIGLISIDSMILVGQGQQKLIIGDSN